MLRPSKLAAAIATASVALVGPALATGTAAHADEKTITVKMTNSGFTLPEETHAGWVNFEVSTKDANGHALQGVRLHKGVTKAQLIADIHEAINPATAASGIRHVKRDATLVGGANVEPSTEVEDTIPLTRGTYWFFDFSQFFVPKAPPPVFHRLEVNGEFEDSMPRFSAVIDQVETKQGPRFHSPSRFDDGDTWLVRNKADEIHEVVFSRVKPGTTDHDITLFFEGKGKNPFLENAQRGLQAQSPGRSELLSFHVKPGTYVMLCFLPDETSGIPHAFLGMHKVVKVN